MALTPGCPHPLRVDAERLRGSTTMARFLIILGLVILVAGLLWPYLSRIGLGRLPGDIVIERDNMTFYFPLMTCLLVSVVLSLLFWLVNR
jgi:hypothetical protein